MKHEPVMVEEVMRALNPVDKKIYVDATFGAGGYSRALLKCTQTAQLIAFDQDPRVAEFADELRREYGTRFTFLRGNFAQLETLLAQAGVAKIDGLMLDLGVSSLQLDEAQRGFSFRHCGPLDMRMSQQGPSAAELLRVLDEQEIADIIYRYGEEKHSRAIARAIVKARGLAPIETTQQLADIVRAVLPRSGKTDPATRTFQALRIAVNDELGVLESVLRAARKCIAPNGRVVVVSFHSLEDRIVKQEFAGSQSRPLTSRHLPPTEEKIVHYWSVAKPAKLFPSEAETKRNPRARSAVLRCALRTEAPC